MQIRARTVARICANPSPRAARELIRLFKEGDEAVRVDALAAAAPGLLGYVLEAVEEEATRLLNSAPSDQNEDLYALTVYRGTDYLTDGDELRHSGELAPGWREWFVRCVQLVGKILEQHTGTAALRQLGAPSDPQVLMILLALTDSKNPIAFFWYPVGLRSRNWLVRSLALDSIDVAGCREVEPMEIAPCLHDENPVVRSKALDVLPRLTTQLVPQAVALLRDRANFNYAWRALADSLSEPSLRAAVIDGVSREYAKPAVASSYEDRDDLTVAAGFAQRLDCSAVPELVERVLSPTRGYPFVVHVLEAMDCQLPRSALGPIKKLLSRRGEHIVRLHILYLCRDLPAFDEELIGLLLENLKDEDWLIRLATLKTLGADRLDKSRALGVFTTALKDESRHCREAALWELGKLGKEARNPLVHFIETAGPEDAKILWVARRMVERLDAQ